MNAVRDGLTRARRIRLGQAIDPTTAAAMENLAPPPPTVPLSDLASWLAPAFGVVGSGVAAGQAVQSAGQNIYNLVQNSDDASNLPNTPGIPTWVYVAGGFLGFALVLMAAKK